MAVKLIDITFLIVESRHGVIGYWQPTELVWVDVNLGAKAWPGITGL